jgi:hypothetical protein
MRWRIDQAGACVRRKEGSKAELLKASRADEMVLSGSCVMSGLVHDGCEDDCILICMCNRMYFVTNLQLFVTICERSHRLTYGR